MSDLPVQAVDLLVVGGGPAGLAAAISAKKNGLENIIVVDRNSWLGGILPQCIHDGFGLELFKQQLTGPEYAQKYIDELEKLKIPYILDSMVLEITPEKRVFVANSKGMHCFDAKAIILAMGCRERTRGQIYIPGTRPAGVFTAGVAQNLINLKNVMIGKDVVILGSGDVGLIMARRLTLEGAKVHAVVEILPHANGLPRNIQQCLIDYNIPLLLSHTVTEIHGQNRVEAVTISPVNKDLKPIPGKEQTIPCDTLLLSIGLIPENDLSKNCGVNLSQVTGGAIVDENLQTSIAGVFACGNALQVHDLVDFVTLEAEKAGESAAKYVMGQLRSEEKISVAAGNKVRYVLPQTIHRNTDLTLSLRVTCPAEDVEIGIFDGQRLLKKEKFRKVHPAQMNRIKGVSITVPDWVDLTEQEVLVTLKPEDVILSCESTVKNPRWVNCKYNILPGVIVEITLMRTLALATVDVGFLVRSKLTLSSLGDSGLSEGDTVNVLFKAEALNISHGSQNT